MLVADFQKGFYAVDHHILEKSEYQGVVRRTSNKWFASYLGGSKQFVATWLLQVKSS